MPSPSRVVLVDAQDRPVGTAGKLEAHVDGRLHRAFSVFVFDAEGRLLLQKRDSRKYHSGGLWSNTCCSHPASDASVEAAAEQRLEEEMGFSCRLAPLFSFTYRAPVGEGLVEHEYDHVFAGRADRPSVTPDPTEVSDVRWAAPDELRRDVAARPERYTPWFRMLLDPALEAAGCRSSRPAPVRSEPSTSA